MRLVIFLTLVSVCLAAPAAQSLTFNDDGSYRFYYETGREGGSHSRTEVRNPDGVVIGKFSYEDPDGEIREVNYRADESGFVANGDVGVKGAPKGQFPINQDERPQEQPPLTTVSVEEAPAEPKKTSEPAAEAKHVESFHDEEDKDEMQDLTLEESAPDDPPEAFPPGFFLQKFQGLRRLPEPTKEDKKPTTTESSKDEKMSPQPEKTEPKDDNKEQTATSTTEPKSGADSVLPRLNPFQALSPQEWASSMFHQPVYVFSYNHPDSYGYHYYF